MGRTPGGERIADLGLDAVAGELLLAGELFELGLDLREPPLGLAPLHRHTQFDTHLDLGLGLVFVAAVAVVAAGADAGIEVGQQLVLGQSAIHLELVLREAEAFELGAGGQGPLQVLLEQVGFGAFRCGQGRG